MYAARPTTWLRTCSPCLVTHSVNTVRICSPHCEATHTVWTQCGLAYRTVDDPHSGNTVRLVAPHCTATKHSPRMAEYGNRGSVELELCDCAKQWNIRYPCGRPLGHVFWLKFNKGESRRSEAMTLRQEPAYVWRFRLPRSSFVKRQCIGCTEASSKGG